MIEKKINISHVPCRKMILQCLFQQLHNRRLVSRFYIFLYPILVHVFEKKSIVKWERKYGNTKVLHPLRLHVKEIGKEALVCKIKY
jgi:hypothetical protein